MDYLEVVFSVMLSGWLIYGYWILYQVKKSIDHFNRYMNDMENRLINSGIDDEVRKEIEDEFDDDLDSFNTDPPVMNNRREMPGYR